MYVGHVCVCTYVCDMYVYVLARNVCVCVHMCVTYTYVYACVCVYVIERYVCGMCMT